MILLVEDNDTIIKGLEYSFKLNNYELVSKKTIKDAIEYIKNNEVNLVILDITLPDNNGIYFFNNYLENIPTIFLTASDDEETIVTLLNSGAEDYITKPFSTKELIARVNKVLNRNKKNNIIKIKDIAFDSSKMIVTKNNKLVELTSLEIKLLYLLFNNLNRVVSRNMILDYIFDITGNDVDDHTVTVYLKRIREKLGTDIIVTVKGIGYRIDYEK